MKNTYKKTTLITLLVALAACSQDTAPALQSAAEAPADQIDLIIMGDYVVSMDSSASVYENGAVAIDDTIFGAGFGADGDGLAEKVDIAVAVAGIGAIGYDNGIAIES